MEKKCRCSALTFDSLCPIHNILFYEDGDEDDDGGGHQAALSSARSDVEDDPTVIEGSVEITLESTHVDSGEADGVEVFPNPTFEGSFEFEIEDEEQAEFLSELARVQATDDLEYDGFEWYDSAARCPDCDIPGTLCIDVDYHGSGGTDVCCSHCAYARHYEGAEASDAIDAWNSMSYQ